MTSAPAQLPLSAAARSAAALKSTPNPAFTPLHPLPRRRMDPHLSASLPPPQSRADTEKHGTRNQ